MNNNIQKNNKYNNKVCYKKDVKNDSSIIMYHNKVTKECLIT